jgi:hypothetical protein
MIQKVVLMRKKAMVLEILILANQLLQKEKVLIKNLMIKQVITRVLLMLQKEMKEDDKDQLQENQVQVDDEVDFLKKDDNFEKSRIKKVV